MQTTEEYLQTCLDMVANRLRNSLDRERKLKEKVAELESGSMSLKLAICELRKYNEWRRDPCIPNTHLQPNPTVLGKAIDTVVDYHSSRIEGFNKCSTHPDAPHGFDRNGSHNAGRYVCDCEGWEPEGY